MINKKLSFTFLILAIVFVGASSCGDQNAGKDADIAAYKAYLANQQGGGSTVTQIITATSATTSTVTVSGTSTNTGTSTVTATSGG